MSYTTGSAADINAVRTALINACTAEGWIWDSGEDVLYKDPAEWGSGIFVRIQAFNDGDDSSLRILGRTGINTGDAPGTVRMTRVGSMPLAFPATYHAFVFEYEVFFVINYSDQYQWCAFGQSSQPGMAGTGNWVAATSGNGICDRQGGINISSSTGGSGFSASMTSAAFMAGGSSNHSGLEPINFYLHNEIEASYPWSTQLGRNDRQGIQWRYIGELWNTQPNAFNNEAVLLPIRTYKERPENKWTQLLEVANARHLRIDNYDPAEVIQLGDDKWMVFPYYRKNVSNRGGGSGITHTGTFGWAIRYEAS